MGEVAIGTEIAGSKERRRLAPLSPVGALVRGVIAGTVGTAAMDALLYFRYRHGGGESKPEDWEFSKGTTWENAAAPAQVGRRIVEGLFQTELPESVAPLVNNVTHWGFGIFWGAQYGIVVGSLPRRRLVYGLPFATGVWASGYVILPAAKLYKPIWDYDAKVLADDLSAHLVYGITTATTLRLLSRRSRVRRDPD
jgi:hypothetical protein